ncbi:uncharacterized protein LOC123676822 [Harmonia axyridis]|uniref:uncharacterized protein LOC123676822 n=1 Tax=Harmonia axyridis TaxID=115357 RepID=UPI001E27999E|nr:uncharacterized protein LOC123676822 [Harmonia axyridis]
MSSIILCFFSVFAILSTSKAALQDDVTAYLTPWMDAAYKSTPLLNLILDEVVFLQRNTMGMDPQILSGLYQTADQQLVNMEGSLNTDDARKCVQGFRIILKITTNAFQSDGRCFKIQQDKAEQAIMPLFDTLFPAAPTAACPIPMLCKFDLFSFNPKNIRELMGALKDLHKHGLKLIKFIVYFKKDITSCRNDPEAYKSISSNILKMAPICQKL